jgi:hypothetical protein
MALVAILFVGGAAAAMLGFYALHRVKEKVHSISQSIGGNSGSSSGSGGGMLASLTGSAGNGNSAADSSDGPKGDLCRFLSKEQVGNAIGTPIIRTTNDTDGCVYYVHGDPATMANKHLNSMLDHIAPDAPASARKQLNAFSGAFFQNTQQNDKSLSAEAATGEVPALSVSFTHGDAEMEMKMTRSMWGRLGGADMQSGKPAVATTGEISGVGDEAYQTADSGLIVRKGQTVIHLMFPSCPCTTVQIKPLAARIADQL